MPMRLLLACACVFGAACTREPSIAKDAPSAEVAPVPLRGAITQIAPPLQSLRECTPIRHYYTKPFWRAPYLKCERSLNGRGESLEIDADSVLVEFDAYWDFPRSQRDSVIAEQVAILSSKLGQSFKCGAYHHIWRRDSLRVSVEVALSPDINGPPTETSPWEAHIMARLGPIFDPFWCERKAGAPQP